MLVLLEKITLYSSGFRFDLHFHRDLLAAKVDLIVFMTDEERAKKTSAGGTQKTTAAAADLSDSDSNSSADWDNQMKQLRQCHKQKQHSKVLNWVRKVKERQQLAQPPPPKKLKTQAQELGPSSQEEEEEEEDPSLTIDYEEYSQRV